jgi:hypothetical protein
MSSIKLYISGFSALHRDGIYTPDGITPWERDQKGPLDVRRNQVLPSPYPSFGKLNIPDRLAFSAAASALSRTNQTVGEKTGICMCIPQGSLSTDLLYMDSVLNGFPSPAFFSATLPSSTIADIAIFFKLKGPDRIFCGGDLPGFSALDTAAYWLKSRKAERVLWVAVWESSGDFTETPEKKTDCAIAILLSNTPESGCLAEMEFRPALLLTSKDQECNEQEIFMGVINSLMKKREEIISVPGRGFRGYISLRYDGY